MSPFRTQFFVTQDIRLGRGHKTQTYWFCEIVMLPNTCMLEYLKDVSLLQFLFSNSIRPIKFNFLF